jgi:protein TonB
MPITDILSDGRRGWRRWAFAAASVVVHAGLIAALVVSTEGEVVAEPEPEDEEVTYVDVRQFAPPPPPQASAPSTPQPQPATPQPQTPQPQPRPQPRPQPSTAPRASDLVDRVDSLPDEPLGETPPVEAPAPRVAPVQGTGATGGSQSGEEAGGVEGGVAGGRTGGVVGGQGEEVPDPGGTFIAAVVDRQAELRNRRDLPRVMQRLYPNALQDAGVGGRVVVQFVVDTNGRVDMSTVKVMSASHDGFVGPTRDALREFRFSPARMGDRSVRMLTQMPIVWEIAR